MHAQEERQALIERASALLSAFASVDGHAFNRQTIRETSEALDRLRDDLLAQAPVYPSSEQEPFAARLARVVEIERRAYDRLALCPDHRDKATGRCIVCVAEERTKRELRSSPLPQTGQTESIRALADLVELNEEYLSGFTPTAVWRETVSRAKKALAAFVSPARTPAPQTWAWYCNNPSGEAWRCLRCRRVMTFVEGAEKVCPNCDQPDLPKVADLRCESCRHARRTATSQFLTCDNLYSPITGQVPLGFGCVLHEPAPPSEASPASPPEAQDMSREAIRERSTLIGTMVYDMKAGTERFERAKAKPEASVSPVPSEAQDDYNGPEPDINNERPLPYRVTTKGVE